MSARAAPGVRALTLAVAAALGATLVTGLLEARRAVSLGAHDLLRAEAVAAVELWRGGAGAGRLDELYPGRWRLEPGTAAELDRPVIRSTPRGLLARTTVYAADGWTPAGTLVLLARSGTGRPPGGAPWWMALTATAGLLAVSGWRVRRLAAGRTAGPRSRAPGLAPAGRATLEWLLTAALLAAPLVSARRSAHEALARLTDLRLRGAAAALAGFIRPGGAGLDPGVVTRVTELPFLLRGAGVGSARTTLPPGDAAALAALPSPPPHRVRVRATPYAAADVGPVRLAMAPLEHTRAPGAVMLATALVGLLLAAVLGLLAPLLARPRELRRNLTAWGFLAPATAHLAVFTLGPLAFALWLSLHRWSLVDVARPFVGLANYGALLHDAGFWSAIRNTAIFTLHVPVAMAVALAFALLVHRRTRTLLWVRTALFLPSVTSLVAIAVVWQWIFNDNYGILNWLLSLGGLGPVRWLTSPKTALLSIMILSVWLIVGYQMVLFQAGLAAIPEELYEAARIDGAGAWQRFLHVTLPGLRHTLFFVLVTSVIGSFQVFGAVYVMTEGGPLGATDVAVYHIYKEAWEFLRFGSAAAQSWVLFAIIFAVTWLHFRVLEHRAEGPVPSTHGVAR